MNVQGRQRQNQPQLNQKDWDNLTPEEFLYKLSMQKLCKYFPDVSYASLADVFSTHNNCYQSTVTALVQSAMCVEDIKLAQSPILSDNALKVLRAAYDECVSKNITYDKKNVEDLRREATEHYQKYEDLMQKGDIYTMRNQQEVARYFLNLAGKQKKMCEAKNNFAAKLILDSNCKSMESYCSLVLDLHGLHVPEAVAAVDSFVNQNILFLREESVFSSDYMFVITGRGRNSYGGVARLKPAIERHLSSRGLRFVDHNPGCLRVELNASSAVTTNTSKH